MSRLKGSGNTLTHAVTCDAEHYLNVHTVLNDYCIFFSQLLAVAMATVSAGRPTCYIYRLL